MCNGARLRGIPVGRMSLPYASYRAGLPASVPTSDCASARAVRSADLRATVAKIAPAMLCHTAATAPGMAASA